MSRPSRDRPPSSFAPTIDFTKKSTAAAEPETEKEPHPKPAKLMTPRRSFGSRVLPARPPVSSHASPTSTPVISRTLPARMSKSIAIAASASPDPIQRDYLVDDQPAIRAAIRLSQEKAEKQARGQVVRKRKSRASKDEDEEEEEEEKDADEDDEWIVERIVAVRPDRSGVKYQVRWRGFSAEEDTFEPFEHIKDTEAYVRFIAVKQNQQEKSDASPAKKKRRTDEEEEEEEEEEDEQENIEVEKEQQKEEEDKEKKRREREVMAWRIRTGSKVSRPFARLPPSPPDSPSSARDSDSDSPPRNRHNKSRSSTASAASNKNKYIASSYSIPESGDKLVPPMRVPAAEPSPSDGQLAPLFSSRFNVTILGKARPSHIPADVAVYRMNKDGKLEWADAREIVKSYQEKVAVKALAAGKKNAAAAAATADHEEHKNSTKH